ncbi:MAG TPA: NADPH-dependent 7-cyano-7-deazaguanine reductase QueF [Burkholderiales bacterium]|nr:NADPH-dependent 7-cyano-7-deazaguanine reductase QueF [Burkholderiales bacterium]
MNEPEIPAKTVLGGDTVYPAAYDPGLLFPIPRRDKRDELGLTSTLPFFGADIWNAYEVSWLNGRGKPQIAIATVIVPADTPNLIESKSFKLYLNSYNQTRIVSPELLTAQLRADLSAAAGAAVQVRLVLPGAFSTLSLGELAGESLDRLDIDIDSYAPDAAGLTVQSDAAIVEETLVSHLLKSNCPVTGQPDWASVQIHYAGAPIDQAGLLRYLIGFRNHNEFHEQCVERIFVDILRACKPVKLSVYARYTRRGGLDINPWRTNFSTAAPPNLRHARQ